MTSKNSKTRAAKAQKAQQARHTRAIVAATAVGAVIAGVGAAIGMGWLDRFLPAYQPAWLAGVRDKLGLAAHVDDDAARELADGFLVLLQTGAVDHTTAFRSLGAAARGDLAPVQGLLPGGELAGSWLRRWSATGPDADLLDRSNPVYVPRNHLVEEALDAATEGDLAPLQHLVAAVTDPFVERPGLERYAAPAPPGSGPHVTFCGT